MVVASKTVTRERIVLANLVSIDYDLTRISIISFQRTIWVWYDKGITSTRRYRKVIWMTAYKASDLLETCCDMYVENDR